MSEYMQRKYDEIMYTDLHDVVSSYIDDVGEFLTYIEQSDRMCEIRWPVSIRINDVDFLHYFDIMRKKCNLRKINIPSHIVITKDDSVDLLDIINDLAPIKGLTFNDGVNISNYVGKLPQSLKILKISCNFNEEFENLFICGELPKSLESLTFGEDFNQRVNFLLLTSLESLTFGEDFNQPVDGLLPESLKHLSFGCDYPFYNSNLLKFIEYDRMGLLGRITDVNMKCYSKFNQPVENLPKSLESLTLGYNFYQRANNLPQSLKHLKFGYKYVSVDNLPTSLETLILADMYSGRVDNLPDSLKILVTGEEYYEPVDNLPPHLEVLILGNRYDWPVDNLPQSLKYLSFGEDFDKDHINDLPNSLETLIIRGVIYDLPFDRNVRSHRGLIV